MSASKRRAPAPGAKPRFFPTPASWRKWLAANHARRESLWVGFWRVATGKRCITWPQSVDEALCFGWIDGQRRGIDAESYMIRFSPRKPGSKWSQINLKRFAELEADGLVHAAGRAARAKWDDARKAGYSYETSRTELDSGPLAKLKGNAKAWRFWRAQVPSYRKMVANWQASPKREATREARLATLIDCCARGKAIPPLAKYVKVKRA